MSLAEAKLRDAQHQIDALHEIIGSMEGELARLRPQEADPGLVVVVKRHPDLFPMPVPLVVGRVLNAQGRLCAIRITDNPSQAEINPGFRFAVFDARGWKALALVVNFDPSPCVAFCRLEGCLEEIAVDDLASTRGMN